MKRTILLVLLLTVVALSSAMPKNCRGRNCRHFRPSRPERPVAPVAPNKRPVAAKRPASALAHIPVVTNPPVTELAVTESASVPEKEMVTDTDGQEVREAGVNGWLDEPTPSPVDPALARTENNSKTDKPGSCDTPKGFGIKCMMRLDQCTNDVHCPGSTKCCMVGECGYLCVKPKPTSTEPKEVTKEIINKKNKGEKTTSRDTADLSTEASEIVESVELAEGALKAEDIIEMPEEMKTEDNVAEEVMEVEQLEGEEMKKKKKNGDESPKEVEKEEGALPKEVEKVIEKVEEILEEEIETAVEEEILGEETEKVVEDEDVEVTTQAPVANEDETLSEK